MSFFSKLFGGKSTNKNNNQPANNAAEEEKNQERDFNVLKFDGVKALNMHEAAYAVECFKHALAIQEDLEVRDYLSQAYIETGELLAAYNELQKLTEAEPDNQSILIRMARVAYAMEDYGAMSDTCEKAILIDNTNPDAYFLYAQASQGQHDLINTIAMSSKCISLCDKKNEEAEGEHKANPTPAYLLRAATLLKMGDINNAMEDADYMLSLEGGNENEDVLLTKARILAAQGNNDEAIEWFSKVIDLNPFCIDAFRDRGAAYLAKGDRMKAAEDAEHVLELNPEEAAAVTGNFKGEGSD